MRRWLLAISPILLLGLILKFGAIGDSSPEPIARSHPPTAPHQALARTTTGFQANPENSSSAKSEVAPFRQFENADDELRRISGLLSESFDPLDHVLSVIFHHAASSHEAVPTIDQVRRIAMMRPLDESTLVWLIEQCNLHGLEQCPVARLTQELRQLAPDNAIAWLRPNPVPVEETDAQQLARAASASRYVGPDVLLLPAVNRALLNHAALDSQQRAMLAIQIAGSMPGPVWWINRCQGESAKSELVAACRQLAEVVFSTGQTILDQALGAGVARNLSPHDAARWDAELERLRALVNRLGDVDCAFKENGVADNFLQDRINAGERYAIEQLLSNDYRCQADQN